MILDMTLANFRSVKNLQTISFEAIKDKRLPEEKTVVFSDKLKVIRSAAIIGPNGAGKSTFVRALESLNSIVKADPEKENPLQLLTGTSFAYSTEKGGPAEISISVIIGKDEETGFPMIYQYTLSADKERIHAEKLYVKIGPSRKMLFNIQLKEPDENGVRKYRYRWGKLYRGDKKRLIKKMKPGHTFLASSARREGESSCKPLYNWFVNNLMILPMGLSSISEKYLVEKITENPQWRKQLINFLWSIDITDIRDVRVQNDRLIFVHSNVTQHYAAYFANESLSLRRLSLVAVSMFEAFTSEKALVLDDFGMLLHPDVIKKIIEIFEENNKKYQSQILAVDCNPHLLRDNLLRRDGIYLTDKDNEGATVYTSLSDYRYSHSKERTPQLYLNGVYGALPITSEFKFSNKKEA